MKRILIVSHAMALGGAERALLGLLENLDNEDVTVDLFLLRHDGELLPMIPSYVHLLPEVPAYTVLARPIAKTMREGHFLISTARLYGKFRALCFNRKNGYTESAVALEYSHKYTRLFLPKIQKDTRYDLAISFLTPHYIVAEKVSAARKTAWIHTDYSAVQVDVSSERKMWGAYDAIASISDRVTDSFLGLFPALKTKITLIENILPQRLIEKQAGEPIPAPSPLAGQSIRLLSIGRFCTPKNFDSVPMICRAIRASGLDVVWYLIGFGSDEQLIRRKIAEAEMQDYVVILGKKENPYPFIQACDLYVQPSRYEGKCVSVREAQMLGKPVVITAYPTASSQLEDGVDGVIVPLDCEKCADGIAALLRNPQKMSALAEACRSRDYTNRDEAQKVLRMAGVVDPEGRCV